jgi:hypothetical protein
MDMMSISEGKAKIAQILQLIKSDPRLYFDSYQIRKDSGTDNHILIIWKERKLFDPIQIKNSRIRDCAETRHGHGIMVNFLKEELNKRMTIKCKSLK